MVRLAAVVAACAFALAAVAVYADGIGAENYDFTHPPSYLKATNSPPSAASATVSFQNGSSASASVQTDDAQAGIQLNAGAIPPAAGQTGVRIDIIPLVHYPPLPSSGLSNGNVYGFRVTYMPSGRTVQRLLSRALVTLIYPFTPTAFLAYLGGRWDTFCTLKQAIHSSSTLSCYERSIAPDIAFLTASQQPTPGASDYALLILGLSTFAIVFVVLSIVIWRNFLSPNRKRAS